MKDRCTRASGKVKELTVAFSVARAGPLPEIAAMDSYGLPNEAEMREAFLRRDAAYDGIFWAGIRTTGIFCRPSCPARNPRPENLSFFDSPVAAGRAGFRPCRRCRPLEAPGACPAWLAPLMEALQADPVRRWTARDLRAIGLAPERVRRWFQKTHGMTFQAYHRARRLGSALERVQAGSPVTHAAFEAGYDSLSGFQEAFRNAFGAPPTKLDAALVVRVDQVATPLGPMFVGASERAVHVLEFADRKALERQLRRTARLLGAVFVPAPSPHGDRLREQLTAYFEGGPAAFDTPMEPAGTAFQREVWTALAAVPPATTMSYGEVAEAIGRPRSVRAVGTAIGANPLAIVVPCHRVVGADGRLTGYAGGLWRKQRLLDLERRTASGV
jgi:AraC family transcriptional regulator, regulatory protein of adaptative response / methylated-DNA-[protein]-cysteine methyltransferase